MTSSSTRSSLPDQRQFHQAISQGGNAWYAACLRITRDAPLAQDAVQDALLNAWRQRHQFNGDARLETWIHRIAINSAIAIVRRRKKGDVELHDEELESAEAKPDTRLTHSELSSDLATAMEALSEMERVCFVLKHLEEWRLAEIAERLQISAGAVKQALFRAVKKLRVNLHTLREL